MKHLSRFSWLTLVCCLLISPSTSSRLAANETASVAINPEKLKPTGQHYEATVPDTLDLAERARLAVRGLTNFLDSSQYNPYGLASFAVKPPFMTTLLAGGVPNWGKIGEGMIMMRLMSGSTENLDLEEKSLKAMIDYAATQSTPGGCVIEARIMMALMSQYQLDPNPALKKIIDGLAENECKGAKRTSDTLGRPCAYYFEPEEQVSGGGYPGVPGYGLLQFCNGTVARALSRWGVQSQNADCLAMAGQLTNFQLQPTYWKPEAEPRAFAGADHAHFMGHHHSYTQGLMGLLWYAEATNNAQIKQFVRHGYEYIRNMGIARIGLYGEMCTTGDMTWLALKLTELGVGDYWEDVDCYVRNQLTEQQITDPDKLNKAIATMPLAADNGTSQNLRKKTMDPKNESNDRVAERCLGVWLSDSSHPTLVPDHSFLWVICCPGNCTPALYATWESMVRCNEHDEARVNLLLNRASKWLDVDSYLPYEGKVVIRNKTAKKLSVRIPLWADLKTVKSSVNGQPAEPGAFGRYLVFEKLSPKDVITLEFPVVETTERYTLKWKQGDVWTESTLPGTEWKADASPAQLTMKFRGNTLVDIAPRIQGPGYPLYLREALKQTKAPLVKVTRYIPPVTVQW